MKISLSAPTKLKTILIVLLVSLAPLLLFAVFTLDSARSSLHESRGRRFEESAGSLIRSIDQMLYARKEDIRQLAADPVFKSIGQQAAAGRLSGQLKKWKKRYGIYSVFSVVSPEGRVIASSQASQVGQDAANERWFKTIAERGLKQGLPYGSGWFGAAGEGTNVLVSGLEYDSLSASYGINFTVPIRNGSNIAGVLVSRMNWSELFELVNAVSVAEGGEQGGAFAVLLDNRARVVSGPGFLVAADAAPGPDTLLFSTDVVPVGSKTQALIKESNRSRQSSYYIDSAADGTQYLMGFAPSVGHLNFRSLGWSVVVMQRLSNALAPVHAMERNLRLVGGITLLTGLAVVLMMLTASEIQLSDYAQVVQAVAEGDYSKKANEGASDLGRLAPGLNRMVSAVRDKVLSLHSQKHEAESINRLKSELLAHIGHELRTPLHGIIELADVMMESAPSAEQRSCAKNIVRSTTSLLSLAHNMVDINTLEQSGGNPDPVAYDMQAIVEEVAEILSLRSAQKGVDLITYYDPGCPRFLMGQPARLHQIFTNMIEHALKMTDEEQILISVHGRTVSSQEARVWVLVEDAGIGLERSNVEAIWKSSESEGAGLYEYKDVGLDLIVSKQIAGLIGGSMGRVGGDAGGAETAWFAITQVIDTDREEREAAPSINLGGARTMVAVDNPVTAKLLAKLLDGWHAQCVLVEDKDQAFAALEESVGAGKPFDYLVTCEDFNGDGQDFIGQISAREDFGRLRTIYFSSLTSLFDASAFGERLPVRVVTAPFAVEDLRRAVEDF